MLTFGEKVVRVGKHLSSFVHVSSLLSFHVAGCGDGDPKTEHCTLDCGPGCWIFGVLCWGMPHHTPINHYIHTLKMILFWSILFYVVTDSCNTLQKRNQQALSHVICFQRHFCYRNACFQGVLRPFWLLAAKNDYLGTITYSKLGSCLFTEADVVYYIEKLQAFYYVRISRHRLLGPLLRR